jgi:hypothetical protein
MLDLWWVVQLIVGVVVGSIIGTFIGYKIFEKKFYQRRKKWVAWFLDALEEELGKRVPNYIERASKVLKQVLSDGLDSPSE